MKKYLVVWMNIRDKNHLEEEETRMIHSLNEQLEGDFSLLVTGSWRKDSLSTLEQSGIDFIQLTADDKAEMNAINRVVNAFPGSHILFVDSTHSPVFLKKACLATFGLAALRHPASAMIYSDYTMESGDQILEKKLLFHHRGRVRDNQDYGKVFLVAKTAWIQSGGLDPKLDFHHWYDLRLKWSEHGPLIRIGNKYGGSLYAVKKADQRANVFDYLLSGKKVQLEAEQVLTAHLKRLGAWLAPGVFTKKIYDIDRRFDLDASIIIPVGHRPEFIGTAIESIQAQTRQNIEAIIVVNGGDEDPTAEVVRRYMPGGPLYDAAKPAIRLLVIDVNNIGLCLNLGVQEARGRYYVQLDSDDRLKPDAVEKILEVFAGNPNIGMVIGSYEVWEKKADGKLYRMEEIPVVTHDEWTPENGRNNLLRINGAGAPRSIPVELIKTMGYFSVNDDPFALNYGEDYEMVNKIAESFEIGRIYDPIYEVVRHSGGTDHSISQDVIDRNDEAKDEIRRVAIGRRIKGGME